MVFAQLLCWCPVLLLCSCSVFETGRYVVPTSHEGLDELSSDRWRTYGLAPRGSGAGRRNTVEPSIGLKRPLVYVRKFDDTLSYALYPTIVYENVLTFGPPDLPPSVGTI